MKEILFIHPSADMYGSDKILINIIKNYNNSKNILLIPKNGPLVETLQEECPRLKIIIYPQLPLIAKKNLKPGGIIKFIHSLFLFKSFLKKNKLNKPTIVYLNTLAVTPILFYFKNSIKLIHVHEILKNNNILHRLINNLAIQYSNYIICVSNAVADNLKLIALQKAHKIITIYNGISFNKRNISISNLKIESQFINFALIGRIKPAQKGQILLLKAISLLKQEYLEKSRFYLIGSTVQGQEYMLDEVLDEIRKRKLEKYVKIIPFTKDIESIYQHIDVSIVPSLVEDSLPTTILESMYFKKPIIGTYIGGSPEMIESGKNGFTFTPNNALALSGHIAFFIQHPEKMGIMGKAGQDIFNEKFTLEIFNKNYTHFISNLFKSQSI